MTDSEFEQSNVEGSDGPPPSARVSTWIAPPPPPYFRRSHPLRNSALLGAAVVALAAGLGLGRVDWKNGPSSVSTSHASMSATSIFGSNSAGTSASSSSSATRSGSTDVSSIADKVDPGLVDIDTLLGFEREEAAGTGIVLTSSGEVVTNNHVINGATAISVKDIANGKVVLGHRCRIRHYKGCCSPPAQRCLRTADGVHRKLLQCIRGRNCRRNRKRRRDWWYAECRRGDGHGSRPVDHRN